MRTLRDAGAPVDAYGCQSHDLTDCDVSKFKDSESKIQDALKMPMYITEYDIGTDNDNLQKQRYQEQIPYLWEKSYCAGITLWGYIYGETWVTNGNSGGESPNYTFNYVPGKLTVMMVDGVASIVPDGEPFDVYTLSGQLVRHQVTTTKGLPRGIYVVRRSGGSLLLRI